MTFLYFGLVGGNMSKHLVVWPLVARPQWPARGSQSQPRSAQTSHMVVALHTGGAVGDQCTVDQAAAEGGRIGGPTLSC